MEDIGNLPVRKRGRPAGKSRKPLNQEQRKARNAQYERERRGEIAEATSQLMEAIGLESTSSISVANLLNSALDLINNKSTQSHSIDDLRKRNDDLSKEIQDLERFLSKQQAKEKKGSSSSGKINQRAKKRKTENEPPANITAQEDSPTVVTISGYDFDLESDIWTCLGPMQ